MTSAQSLEGTLEDLTCFLLLLLYYHYCAFFLYYFTATPTPHFQLCKQQQQKQQKQKQPHEFAQAKSIPPKDCGDNNSGGTSTPMLCVRSRGEKRRGAHEPHNELHHKFHNQHTNISPPPTWADPHTPSKIQTCRHTHAQQNSHALALSRTLLLSTPVIHNDAIRRKAVVRTTRVPLTS